MKEKIALFYQPCGLGDILFLLKAAKYFKEKGYEIWWPVVHELFWLNEYIDYVNFVSWGDENNLLKRPPLPDHVEFPYKEKYLHDAKTEITNDFVFFQGFINERPIMEAKYRSIGMSSDGWRKEILYNPDEQKEKELFFDVLGLKENEEYTIVNNRYQTRPFPKYNEQVPMNHEGKVVKLDPIDGYSMFDWRLVILNAKKIFMIETAWNYFLESPYLIDSVNKKELHLYSRHRHYHEVQYLFTLPWNYHI